jgi:hypothetical protein
LTTLPEKQKSLTRGTHIEAAILSVIQNPHGIDFIEPLLLLRAGKVGARGAEGFIAQILTPFFTGQIPGQPAACFSDEVLWSPAPETGGVIVAGDGEEFPVGG